MTTSARAKQLASKRRKASPQPHELDSVYFLKLVIYMLIGSIWLRVFKQTASIPLPVGLLVGLVFARVDRFQVDRKIEYAVLLVSMFLGYWLVPGISILIN